MKGIVFTEFLKMVELCFDAETVETIIVEGNLPSGGAYTSVGTYPHDEMLTLLTCLSARTGLSTDDLMRTYGKQMFGVLHSQIPHEDPGAYSDTFSLLTDIQNKIHAEVFKLYPDADLPRFEHTMLSKDTLQLKYLSERGMASFAEGLISGCIAHFGETITVERTDLGQASGHEAIFTLKRTA